KFGSPALASENINILQRELDPLFRREDANPAGIWGECMIVKLHCISHFEPSKAPRDGFIASVVNSVFLRRAPCLLLGSPTHYHRHFPDVGDRARNRPADRLR